MQVPLVYWRCTQCGTVFPTESRAVHRGLSDPASIPCPYCLVAGRPDSECVPISGEELAKCKVEVESE